MYPLVYQKVLVEGIQRSVAERKYVPTYKPNRRKSGGGGTYLHTNLIGERAEEEEEEEGEGEGEGEDEDEDEDEKEEEKGIMEERKERDNWKEQKKKK
ncbi:hypothetical protein E2C01_001370 [Portunus trituberculatus]|uniref:Uncharacterized protein n=1 Tax=Portunus trituberculatus TaxID=210409 RepID=A0A5B7CHU0_PORTR|nr:hypothetical protein [Portunus trituberculatus]